MMMDSVKRRRSVTFEVGQVVYSLFHDFAVSKGLIFVKREKLLELKVPQILWQLFLN